MWLLLDKHGLKFHLTKCFGIAQVLTRKKKKSMQPENANLKKPVSIKLELKLLD